VDPVVPVDLAAAIAPAWSAPVEWHASVDSTMSLAAGRAQAGAAEGLVIGADHQTAGRGRRGRAWIDEPGTAIAMSLLLRPDCPPAQVGMVAIVVAVGVAAALQELTGHAPEIVWPNDVLLDGAKTSGILCESSLSSSRVNWVVAGIGCNVRVTPPGVAGRWTPGSLAGAGFGGTREEAAAALLIAVADAYRSWRDSGSEPILRAFGDRDALYGREIVVEAANGHIRGHAAGIDETGRLKVARGPDTVAVAAGDVTRIVR
jgi:BirA family biotin operon repressor/biotin-[acetyl-CoA-carboxylase] ligase